MVAIDDQLFLRYELNSTIGFQLFFHGAFEFEPLQYCRRFIGEGSVVLDVGANIGVYACHYAPMCRSGLVLAFEPGKRVFNLLVKNVASLPNVIPLNIALSNQSGLLSFYENIDSAYSSLQQTGRGVVQTERKVLGCTVDDIILTLRLDRLDFLKIDVEGLEAEVVEGASESIKRFRPVILCEICERNSKKDSKVLVNYLIEIGYIAFVFQHGKLVSFVEHSDDSQDYLFIPKRSYGAED